MAESRPTASSADPLAWETTREDLDPGSVSANCSDIGVDGDSGEPLPEDALSELVELAEPGVLEPGEVESVGKEAAAIEESADTERHKPLSRRNENSESDSFMH